jgi:hypothetical protein
MARVALLVQFCLGPGRVRTTSVIIQPVEIYCHLRPMLHCESVFHRPKYFVIELDLQQGDVFYCLRFGDKTMRLILLGIFVALLPSVVAVAWLLWQADRAEKASGSNADRLT